MNLPNAPKNKTIGIPRMLGYQYFYPFWQFFFTQLGFNVQTSDPTDRENLNNGIRIAPSDACLPLKCYLGHVINLLARVDFIFVPRLVCLQVKPKIGLGCPKFIGLPDMVAALIPQANILSVDIDLRIESERRSYLVLANMLGSGFSQAESVYTKSLTHLEQHKTGGNREESATDRKRIRIGLLGHSYLLKDNFLNLDLQKKLNDLGCEVIPCYDMPSGLIREQAECIKPVSWYFEEEILCAASLFLQSQNIAGIVYLLSFGCGAGSITSEIIELEIRKQSAVPLLRLVIDEHTGEVGLMTRLETFVDMIRLQRNNKEIN